MSATTCLMCLALADGTRRIAFWEEEEKGRLSAKSAAVCEACLARFLSGELSRVDVARRAHEARGYRPAEWIGRIDRDALLDISCLFCGILLPVGAVPPDRVTCPSCGAVNLFAERRTVAATTRVSARLESAP